MNPLPDALTAEKTSLLHVREELAHSLGVQTVDVLIDRAVAEASMVHPGLEGLRLDAGVLSLDGLDTSFAESTDEEVRTAFRALTAVLLLILGRLVGRQIADGLAASLAATRTEPFLRRPLRAV
jgi:hypothetical protein